MKVIETFRSWPRAHLATCRDADGVDFYREGRSQADVREVERAKEVCRGCRCVTRCLEFALEERFGIWGATTPKERSRIRAARREAA